MTPETFFEKFHLLADAPDAVAKMRELVLKLAVSGKLVPFNVPAEESSVGDHIEFLNGYAFKSTWFKATGIRLCRNANVGHGALDWRDSAFVDEQIAEEFKRFALNEGDIVLSLDRPLISTGLKVAQVKQADLPCLLLQRVAKPIPKHDGIDLRYFLLWLNSAEFIGSIDPGRSNGVPHISTRQVQRLRFVLPPFAEQKRIVAKVDELMALCDRLEEQQRERDARHAGLVRASLARFTAAPTPANLDFLFHNSYTIPPAELRKAILTLAVQGELVPQDPEDDCAADYLGRPTRLDASKVPRLPSNWTWARIDETGQVDLGRQRAPQHHRGPNMRPYLRVQNVYEARIDVSDVKEMNFTPAEFERFALCSGDILLNEGQSRELVGRPAIYRDEVPGACFQNTLVRYRGFPFVEPEYALLVFRAYMHNGRFQEISKQTTNIAHLSAGRFATLEFPLPPLAEQRRIVAKVDQLMVLVDQLKTQLATSQTTAKNLLEAVIAESTGPIARPIEKLIEARSGK